MDDLRPLLEGATTIELIDWPHQNVPATLARAGYTVVGHEPDGYQSYSVGPLPPEGAPGRSFPLEDGSYLISHPIEALPAEVGIVNTFRPADEQAAIARAALEVGARVLWIQPGEETSPEAREIAEAAGLTFVDGIGIDEAVRRLSITKNPRPE